MAASSGIDFGLPVTARIAIIPRDYNREAVADDCVIVGRDVDDGLRGFAGGGSVLFLARPDRYVAGASHGDLAAIQEMAAQIRAMGANCAA